MALLEQTVIVPIPGRTAANGASRFTLFGRRHSSNRSGRGLGDLLSASTADPKGAIVPGRQWGRPSLGARGLCIAPWTLSSGGFIFTRVGPPLPNC